MHRSIPALIGCFLLAGVACAAQSAPALAKSTVQAWCALGHGGSAPAKLGALTWNQFDLLAGTVDADIDPHLSMVQQLPADARDSYWEMTSVGSEDEYVFAAWLRGMATPSPMRADPLPRNVDAVRAVAARLRQEVAAKAGPFKDAGHRMSAAKALADFSRFEKIADRYAPVLAKSCGG